jgi:hypothetical protein
LGKISDFHHSKLILPSKTQKRHFNSIKISQVKNKKRIKGDKFGENLMAKSIKMVKGDKINVIGID